MTRHPTESTGTPAAGLATDSPLEWSVNPWKESPGSAVLALLIMIGLGGVFLKSPSLALMALALWFVMLVTLSPAFMVLRCRVDQSGVARRHLLVWERRPWERIGRARLGRLGLFVSPPATPRWLDGFRGLWLPVRASSEEGGRIVSELRRRLKEHGL